MHEAQALPQLLMQHTPSTQFPVPHWLPTVHAAPSARRAAQVPLVQPFEAAQSASPLQWVGQLALLPSHRYGAQLGEPAAPSARGWQVPPPQVSQAPVQPVSQHTPSTQWPLVHCEAPVQACPSPRRGRQAPVAEQ